MKVCFKVQMYCVIINWGETLLTITKELNLYRIMFNSDQFCICCFLFIQILKLIFERYLLFVN